MRLAILCAALVVAAASEASAAYAPRLTIEYEPALPGRPAALTTRLTQEPGESAHKEIRIRYPPAFGYNPGFDVVGCTGEEEARDACPASSQIGEAETETDLGTFAGPVFFTEDYRILTYYRAVGGLVQSKVVTTLEVLDDGSTQTVTTDLPNTSARSSRTELYGGARSLSLTPESCGTYTITGKFLSHEGEQATSEANVEISGCDTRPRLSGLRARARRAGGKTRATIRYSLSERGRRTLVTLERLRSRRPWQRWSAVAKRRGPAPAGRTRLKLAQALRPGTYRAAVAVTSVGGRLTDRAFVTFTVL